MKAQDKTLDRPEDYDLLTLKEMADMGFTLSEYMAMFGGPEYAVRNAIITAMMAGAEPAPTRVLELACACGFLAEMVMKRFPKVEYTCTNFSPLYLQYTEAQLDHYPKCCVLPVNADVDTNKDLNEDNFKPYDTVVCTSLEHLKNDLGLIVEIPSGTRFYFSVNNIFQPGHFRAFDDADEVRERYEDLLDIQNIVTVPRYFNFYIVSSVVR